MKSKFKLNQTVSVRDVGIGTIIDINFDSFGCYYSVYFLPDDDSGFEYINYYNEDDLTLYTINQTKKNLLDE